MLKRNHKAIAVVMAFAICLSFLAPAFVAPNVASAATYTTPTVPSVSKTGGQTLGSIIMDFSVLSNGYHRGIVKLPDGFAVGTPGIADMSEYAAGAPIFRQVATTPVAGAVPQIFTANMTVLPAANDTLTLGAEVYTAVAAAPPANSFVIGVDIPTTTANLRAAINANPLSLYTASGTGAALTLTQKAALVGAAPAYAVTGALTFGAVTNPQPFVAAATTAGQFRLVALSGNQLQVEVFANGVLQKVKFAVLLNNVTVPSSAETEIKATVLKLDGDFSDNYVTVGKTTGGALDVMRSDPPTMTAGNSNVTFTVREDVAAAMAEGSDTVKIKLPKGVTFVSAAIHDFPGIAAAYAGSNAFVAGPAGAADYFDVNITDSSVLKLSRTTINPATWVAGVGGSPATATVVPQTVKKTFTVKAVVNVNEEEAAKGDVIATVSGKSTINTAQVKIGTYADFGYKVTVDKAETPIVAGVSAEKISKVTVSENVPQSLLAGRTVIATLPTGVEWNAATFAATNKAGGLAINFTRSANDKSKATGAIVNAAGSPKGECALTDIEVNSAVDFTGPVEIQFSGSAGINDKITVAKVEAPITAKAETKDVIIGVQGQAAGTITVTENKAEAINSRTVAGGQAWLNITAPFGVTWANLPTVKVAEGDMVIGTVQRGNDPATGKHQLQIPIRTVSSKASKLEISNITYTVDRTVPEGEMKLTIGGSAVDQVAITNRTTAATVVAAKVITPAPNQGTVGAVAGEFKIDSNIYQVNGVSKIMDASPYVKAGRTYVPVKYLGLALGVAEKDIVWDAATQKATLTLGDKKVELTIGSTSYSVNGEAKTMDVAPEISNGRTMLPAKYVAEGLGFIVGWDPATRTVLVSK